MVCADAWIPPSDEYDDWNPPSIKIERKEKVMEKKPERGQEKSYDVDVCGEQPSKSLNPRIKFLVLMTNTSSHIESHMPPHHKAIVKICDTHGEAVRYIKDRLTFIKDDGSDKIPAVRVHSMCLTGDVFHSLKCDCNSQLFNALKYIEHYGKGAVVYLTDHEGRGIGLCNKIKAYKLQEEGQDTIQANISLGFKSDLRDYGTGAQILVDLGYTDFNLITNNPKKIIGLEGYGLNVLDTIKVDSEVTEYNKRYLETKKEKMHHFL